MTEGTAYTRPQIEGRFQPARPRWTGGRSDTKLRLMTTGASATLLWDRAASYRRPKMKSRHRGSREYERNIRTRHHHRNEGARGARCLAGPSAETRHHAGDAAAARLG